MHFFPLFDAKARRSIHIVVVVEVAVAVAVAVHILRFYPKKM